jgi:uncharacterized protein
LSEKVKQLRSILRDTGGVLVAFSGGVDSSVLVAVAVEELGDRVLAVTAVSPVYPRRELALARETAARLGVRHVELSVDHLAEIAGFADNPPERCYICKLAMFTRLRKMADEEGLVLCHGGHADDLLEDRPGHKATLEVGARAPLAEAEMTKPEIRELARELGLPGADLPAMACLATRFPFGARITDEGLRQVAAAEEFLADVGFANYRARHHGDVLRIEVPATEFLKLTDESLRARVVEFMRGLGFKHVTVDLAGYRVGGAN